MALGKAWGSSPYVRLWHCRGSLRGDPAPSTVGLWTGELVGIWRPDQESQFLLWLLTSASAPQHLVVPCRAGQAPPSLWFTHPPGNTMACEPGLPIPAGQGTWFPVTIAAPALPVMVTCGHACRASEPMVAFPPANSGHTGQASLRFSVMLVPSRAPPFGESVSSGRSSGHRRWVISVDSFQWERPAEPQTPSSDSAKDVPVSPPGVCWPPSCPSFREPPQEH